MTSCSRCVPFAGDPCQQATVCCLLCRTRGLHWLRMPPRVPRRWPVLCWLPQPPSHVVPTTHHLDRRVLQLLTEPKLDILKVLCENGNGQFTDALVRTTTTVFGALGTLLPVVAHAIRTAVATLFCNHFTRVKWFQLTAPRTPRVTCSTL